MIALAARAGASEKFDIATMRVPATWSRVVIPGGLGLRAPDVLDGERGMAQIVLLAARPSNSSAAEAFHADWRRLVTPSYPQLAPAGTQAEQQANGWLSVTGAARFESPSGGVVVLLSTSTADRRVFSVLGTFSGDAHRRAVEQFFAALELDPVTTPSSAARATEGALMSGRFEGNEPLGLFARLRVNATGSARVGAETWLFMTGHRVQRAFPLGAKADGTHCAPDTCGAFSLAGSTLQVRWDNGRSDSWSLVRNAAGVALDDTQFRAAAAVGAAELIGRWIAPGSGFDNAYTFRADGTFSFGAGSTTAASGRYGVRGLALELSFADGSRALRTAFSASSASPARMIVIDDEVFSKE